MKKNEILSILEEKVPVFFDYWEKETDSWKNWKTEQKTKIIMFGAAGMAGKCCKYLDMLGVKVDLICDNSKERWGSFQTENGESIPVVSVEEAFAEKNAFCFLAAGYHHFDAICNQLEQYSIGKIVRQWHVDFHLELFLLLRKWGRAHWMEKFEELFSYYDDEESYEILFHHFDSLFLLQNMPVGQNGIGFEPLCRRPQYFLEDGRFLGKQGVMVDCGSFIGDTFEDLMEKTQYTDFDFYDCYEMDRSNYEKLLATVKKYPEDIQQKVRANNMGVGDEKQEIRYCFNNGGSVIDDNGECVAQIVKLDDRYPEGVTFIKMDIEGSEQRALRGAERLISTSKPMCAICIYHELFAFWEVPQMLKSYVPEYHMILRHHTTWWDDSVCYAKLGEWK